MAIADSFAPRPVLASRTAFDGRVWSIDVEDVELADGVVTREFLRHPGAVAVMPYDGEGSVYLVRQYRHPVRRELWEPPAGLLDVVGEDPLAAAKRELLEEADLTASTWHVLLDLYTSPGGTSELIRIYLATDLTPVGEEDRYVREAEESDMEGHWVPLADVLTAIAAGNVCGPTLTAGAFALDAAKRSGWQTLRPATARWPQREGLPI